MKKIFVKILVVIGMIFSLTSCKKLPLQDTYDFSPEVDFTDPFKNMTAWEWVQTRNKLQSNGQFDPQELNYFIAAIKKAGMEDEYSQTVTKDRTYLLLNNDAFTGNGDVIHIVTGSAAVPAGETAEQTMARVNTPEKLAKLRTVLRYHIVTSYIAQVPTLYEFDVDYLFRTLIPGADGLIAFRRDELWRITINRVPAPLPETALSEWETVLRHNYVFKNGIGHIIADPVRNKPY